MLARNSIRLIFKTKMKFKNWDIIVIFCFVLFSFVWYITICETVHTMHNAHTHTRADFSQFVFLPLLDSIFVFRMWCVCVLKITDLVFRVFFSLLPPPLHRFNSRQRTLTLKSTKSTKSRTFNGDDTLLADSRGFLTTTSTSEGLYSGNFSVSVGGVSIEGGEC